MNFINGNTYFGTKHLKTKNMNFINGNTYFGTKHLKTKNMNFINGNTYFGTIQIKNINGISTLARCMYDERGYLFIIYNIDQLNLDTNVKKFIQKHKQECLALVTSDIIASENLQKNRMFNKQTFNRKRYNGFYNKSGTYLGHGTLVGVPKRYLSTVNFVFYDRSRSNVFLKKVHFLSK